MGGVFDQLLLTDFCDRIELAEQHGRDEVGAAALVLLGRGRRVDVALVARDRLVLGAVVAHELAVAQREERRDQADQGRPSSPRKRHGA